MKQANQIKRLKPLFPLTRQLSFHVTPLLIRTPITPNLITLASLLSGVLASLLISIGDYTTTLCSAVMLFFAYLLDNCDGEVARAKTQESKFGEMFDSFSDWVVHGAFFFGLGWGTYASTTQVFWVWLGIAATLGASINYSICVYLFVQSNKDEIGTYETTQNNNVSDMQINWKGKVVYIYRELARSDFWLIVLVLALFDLTWLLLPAAAIGSQVYWIMQFFVQGRNDRK